MKAYNIILFMTLQSFISIVFSQEIRDGFEISSVKNTTWFNDVYRSNFRGFPLVNEKGEKLHNPTSTFSSKEKMKKIECDLYSVEKQNYLLIHYKPRANVIVNAVDGKIVAVSFGFENLSNPSKIDIERLQIMRNRIMAEICFEDLSFNGEQAVSGYISSFIRFFRP